jgi:acyl carrier protein
MNGFAERRAALRAWVADRVGAVADDAPLIAEGRIDSLQLVELVLFLEELTGRRPRVEQLVPGAFRDIDTISRRFLEDAGNEEATE